MSSHNTRIFRQTALIAFLFASPPASANETNLNTRWPLNSAIQTEAGQRIPAGAFGIVLIKTPREATLLQLRGMAGRGDVILRSGDSRDCLTLPVRFIAGDFGGNKISTRSAQPIRLIIESARVAQALADAQDVVSDMYRISSTDDDPDADIVIQTGLSESHGFVLNPGSSILADILGVTTSRTACSEI